MSRPFNFDAELAILFSQPLKMVQKYRYRINSEFLSVIYPEYRAARIDRIWISETVRAALYFIM